MSVNEKETPVAFLTISRPAPTHLNTNDEKVHSTVEDGDSTHSHTPQLNSVHTFDREGSPLSPCDTHSQTRLSLEAQKTESKNNANPFESDLESCLHATKLTRTKTTCSVWPGQQGLKEERRLEKQKRGFNPMRKLDKRTRVWVKILICLIVIGAAIGIGLGISKAVGAGFWTAGNPGI